MKFAQAFSKELESHEYPPEWQDAAIRYKLLKKCIRKIMVQLAELGLNARTLKLLHARSEAGKDVVEKMKRLGVWETVPETRRLSMGSVGSTLGEEPIDDQQSVNCEDGNLFLYPVNEMNDISVSVNASWGERGITLKYWLDGTLQEFVPKLVLTVDEDQGIPLSLNLTNEVRILLERLVASQRPEASNAKGLENKESAVRAGEILLVPATATAEPELVAGPRACQVTNAGNLSDEKPTEDHNSSAGFGKKWTASAQMDEGSQLCRKFQIPLSADAEFFQLLSSEIATLDVIQSNEEKDISAQVIAMGDKITEVTKPHIFTPHSDLYPWREIFRLYAEANIFFNTSETGRRQRPVETAEEKIRLWLMDVKKNGIPCQFRHKNSQTLFLHFIDINMSILRLLRFQSINRTAMMKILKKFDKRTSFNVREKYLTFVSVDPFLSHQLARALCFTLTTHLLSSVPQLDDYLCPICSYIAVKPVRLSCMHVFCVRCLVKLQRDAKKACPICRSNVVMEANASNLDTALLNLLVSYFPKEYKEKQAENDREATVELCKLIDGRRDSCAIA